MTTPTEPPRSAYDTFRETDPLGLNRVNFEYAVRELAKAEFDLGDSDHETADLDEINERLRQAYARIWHDYNKAIVIASQGTTHAMSEVTVRECFRELESLAIAVLQPWAVVQGTARNASEKIKLLKEAQERWLRLFTGQPAEPEKERTTT